MPCALEALTVIKTSVVGLFPSCERTGENAKDWMSSTRKAKQTKTNKQQTNTTPKQKGHPAN